MSKQARHAMTLTAIAAAVVAVWVCMPGVRAPKPGDEAAMVAVKPGSSTLIGSASVPPRNDAPALLTTPPPEESADVIIDGIDVDKTKVCRGAEVTVTVRVRTAPGAEPYLRCNVPDQHELVGCRFTLRPERSIAQNDIQVFATAKNPVVATAYVPAITVGDCVEPHQLTIALQTRVNAPDRGWFKAEIAAQGGDPFTPVAYDWDFGDGRTETTRDAAVQHSYEHRLQTQASSYFMVTVTARSATGRTLSASRSVEFANLGFSPWMRHQRVVVFSGVEEDAAGGERIWLYHGAPASVFLEKVVLKKRMPGKQPETLAEYDARSFLGFTELRAGESRVLWSLARYEPSEPNATHIVEVRGRATGARTADGAFTLLFRSAATAALDHDHTEPDTAGGNE
jgi:hypothetical protein